MNNLMQCPEEIWILRGPKQLPELYKFFLLDFCGLYMNSKKELLKPIYGLNSKHGLVLRLLDHTELEKDSEEFRNEINLDSDKFFFSNSRSSNNAIFTDYKLALTVYKNRISEIIKNLQNSVNDYEYRIGKMNEEEEKQKRKEETKQTNEISKLDEKRKQKKNKDKK